MRLGVISEFEIWPLYVESIRAVQAAIGERQSQDMEIQKVRVNRSIWGSAFSFLDLLYYSIVRGIRTQNGNANLGLLIGIMQVFALLAIFALLINSLGLRTFAIRGDFVLYLLSGIFLFLTHIRAVNSLKRGGGASGMMLHAPLNSALLATLSSALSFLYMQLLTFSLIMFALYMWRGEVEIYNPAGIFLPFFMAWASGVAIGYLFRVLTPFAPKFIPLFSMLYRRAQMLTSGKMLPANYMSAGMVTWFSWNPLFHCIDQMRGAIFVNYVPRNTNMEYPIILTIVLFCIAMIIDFWLSRNKSASWGKRSIL